MRIGLVIAMSLLSLAGRAAPGQGGTLEAFPSKLLERKVRIAVHVPSEASVSRWDAAHPGWKPRLVLFLNGAYDGPEDLLKQGIYADLAAREEAGALPPSLWVAPEHFMTWYADRKDGKFPYERFLVDELIPAMERAHPGYGGSKEARSIAGLSMGAFGALNLSARTGAFARCAALSPALVEAPFKSAGFWVRGSLKKAFPLDPEAFAPWNPWRHPGDGAELVLGCGSEDRYGLARVTAVFAQKCAEAGHPPVATLYAPGNHDWGFWTPAFEELAPWLAGDAPPTRLSP
ncbi:MAG TPA: alpha/beta hydrolase-fold protein [Holophagaceae bacterium]|nr:alpha/beta hydrolase-fold protein [Holophagaceae bacterium]